MESLQHFKLYFKSRPLSTPHVHCSQQNWIPLKSMSLYHHRTSSFRFHTCDLNSWQEFIFRMQLCCLKLGGRESQTMYLCITQESEGGLGYFSCPDIVFQMLGKKRGILNEQAKIALCTV